MRSFSDPNVIHVNNRVDPNDDLAIVETELALADLEAAKKRLEQITKQMKAGADKKVLQQKAVLEAVVAGLEQGTAARDHERFAEFKELFHDLQLLTAKPQLVVVNTDDGMPTVVALNTKSPIIYISARTEAELADLSPEEAAAYLRESGTEQSGLDKLIVAGYTLLNLITFLTSGEPETRAWTVRAGATAPQAAGVIHTDFEKTFIRAEVVNWKDFVEQNGWVGAKEKGLVRIEGKEYVLRDGDVCYFRVGA